MKKIIISLVILLLIILLSLTLVNGVRIGGFEAFGVSGMKQKNEEINDKITKVSQLTSTDFPKKMSEMTSSSKELLKIKEDYQDLTNYSTDSQLSQANELPDYEVEYLWAKVGEHATKEGIDIKMDISTAAIPTSVDGRKLYNLNYTATGNYIGIASFVSALENDSSLQFKIESFKMMPASNELQATFIVKDVPIKLNNLSSGASAGNAQAGGNTNQTAPTNQTNPGATGAETGNTNQTAPGGTNTANTAVGY